MLTLMYLKKLENQTDKAIKIIMISTIIESILMLFLVISFIAMKIYLWNGQNILDTGSALLAIIPSSLYNSVGVLVDVLGLICLIVSFINLIHIYENKANLAIERNELYKKEGICMSSLKVLYAYSKGLRKYFVAAILFVIIETSFEVIIPLLMSDIIDIGIVQKDTSVFIEKGIQMMICALLSLICGLLYARYASKAITLYGEKLRSIQYAKIQEYAFINLDHFETSSLITRLTSDVTVIQNSLINGIRPFARGPVILLLGLVMSFIINKELSIIFLFTTPVLGIILFFIVRKVAPMYKYLQKAVDRVNQIIQENLTAIRAIKAFVRDEYEEDKFEKVNHDLARFFRIHFTMHLLIRRLFS